MEWSFGDSSWDIYENHKGNWCLYRSKLCQEGRCVDCNVYIESKEKFDTLFAKFLKVED
jgi:hypothetical protein